eukprot:g4082.t1
MASLATDDNDTTTTTNSELQHFEDIPGILQICTGLIAYFDDDILAMINMFAKTCKKFLECKPLRQKYFKVVLAKKYSVNFGGKTMNLDGKNIHDEDLRNVGEALKTNNTLEELHLRNNNITDVQSIGELLKTNHTLTTLNLRNNNITDVQSIGE